MGDISKCSLISDFKTHFSIFRTKAPVVIAFLFIFIAFTIFFAFTPPSSSSVFTQVFLVANTTPTHDSHISSIFLYFFPNSSSPPQTQIESSHQNDDLRKALLNCDFFDGNWVRDNSYPLYNPNSCSLIDEQFNCFLNGRPDTGYYKLKWKPKGCTLPR